MDEDNEARRPLLIGAHFRTADRLGVVWVAAMEVLRDELWRDRGRPIRARVQAATERLGEGRMP